MHGLGLSRLATVQQRWRDERALLRFGARQLDVIGGHQFGFAPQFSDPTQHFATL